MNLWERDCTKLVFNGSLFLKKEYDDFTWMSNPNAIQDLQMYIIENKNSKRFLIAYWSFIKAEF